MIICFIISVSSVSALDLNQTNSTNVLSVEGISILNVEVEIPDEPDLIVNDTIYITSDNIDDYFTNGKLSSRFDNKTLIFNQNFENLGKLEINASNVTINGAGHILKNTVFQVDARDVTLSNLNLDLDSAFPMNEGAGIEILSNNVNLIKFVD